METDTIRNGIIYHLADDELEIAANVDKETGSVSYSIAIAPYESAAVEDNDSQKKILARHPHVSKKLYFCSRIDFIMK